VHDVAGRGAPDASPGHVVHFQIGTSAAMGNVWDWDDLSRRLNYSYVVDWADMGTDFLTLGAVPRVYETVQKAPGHEIFGYWNVRDFEPERWKNEYANPAFDRMTERDAAWMARILARFTPEMTRALAELGKLSDPSNTAYLQEVLDGRLHKILERYLLRLSPMANVHLEGQDRLCAVDLAEPSWRTCTIWGRRGASSSPGSSAPILEACDYRQRRASLRRSRAWAAAGIGRSVTRRRSPGMRR